MTYFVVFNRPYRFNILFPHQVDKLIKALKSHYLELENEDHDSTPGDNDNKDLTTSVNKQVMLLVNIYER